MCGRTHLTLRSSGRTRGRVYSCFSFISMSKYKICELVALNYPECDISSCIKCYDLSPPTRDVNDSVT